MNDLIKVNKNEQGDFRVSARQLYDALGVSKNTRFSRWFEMNSKQLIENEDFWSVLISTQQNQYGGLKTIQDYSLTIEAAKHIALMSGTQKGSEIRSYFIEVENEYKALINNPAYQMAMGLQASQKLIEQKDQLIAELKPKALFAEAFESTDSLISVGDMAKVIKQNGFDIGQNKLFEWLRENGYLIKRPGLDYNSPTQRSMKLGLFFIKETVIHRSNGISLKKTVKVTGKGQKYFVKKFSEIKEGAAS